MKTFSEYINELRQNYIFGGTDNRNANDVIYKYFPKDKNALVDIMNKLIKERGNECDLNDIDTSKVTDFVQLIGSMNDRDSFNCDISQWDTSKVTNMNSMFSGAKSFNQDISGWDTSKVIDMTGMFFHAKSFNQDISNWDTRKVDSAYKMFGDCPIKEEYKPKFRQ